jgi:phosphopantothenoylcysteine decarboxylase/phosphopantothenate--cysteine ligase
VVLGVTGGIAAYKAAELCRTLVKAGARVRVVMTDAACQFITPLTLQTLSGAKVGRDLFDLDEESEIGHIRLADSADLIIVAPATADVIARLGAGMADDLLAAVVLASKAPVLLAPAMNVNMWENPLTQANLGRLLRDGGEAGRAARFSTVGPDRGELACGWIGAGRLIEPAEIVAAAERILSGGALAGRKVVVTAGPTQEPIDDVRFLGNRSSGKMGFALAEAAAAQGADVLLVAGPVGLATPSGVTRRIDVESADEMQRALGAVAPAADVVVMAAAVADFRPAARVAGKLSRRAPGGAALTLRLEANPDILAELGRARGGAVGPGDARASAGRAGGGRPFLVGFAAEPAGGAELLARARLKLAEKGCDAIVANDISRPGTGFGADDNEATLLFRDGRAVALARAPKRALADAIWAQLGPALDAAAAGATPSAPIAVPPAARAAGGRARATRGKKQNA